MASAELSVEVVYAAAGRCVVEKLKVPAGTTLFEAVQRSGLLQRFPEIDPALPRLGVHGRLREPQATVADGDRVEIYRPLRADPKDARRQRLAHKRRQR